MSHSVNLKLAHADHNYDVCHFLNKADIKANDWIVTTAFYSAIHYCEKGLLFPADYYVDPETEDLDYYLSFEDFYRAFTSSSDARKNASPHKCRRWLIESQVSEISFEYAALADVCHTARYKNYRISDKDKSDSIEYLESIKTFCK